MANLQYVANQQRMSVTIGSNYTVADGSIVLTGGHGARLPATGDFWLKPTEEDIAGGETYQVWKCTSRSTDTLTVTPAEDGTTDTNVASGVDLEWIEGKAAREQQRADLLPTRATLWHDESTTTAGNTVSPTGDGNQWHDIYAGPSTGADGDTFTQSLVLAAGTYEFKVLGITFTNRGKIDWYIDDVTFETGQDWYAGGLNYNVTKTVSALAVVGNGRHVLKGVTNGKNGSSSAYNMTLTKMWFYPATDVGSV